MRKFVDDKNISEFYNNTQKYFNSLNYLILKKILIEKIKYI